MIYFENLVLPSSTQMKFIIEAMRKTSNDPGESDSYIEMCSMGFGESRPCDPECAHPYCRGPYIDNEIGKNDKELLINMAKSGRNLDILLKMFTVYVSITAPAQWWKYVDTFYPGSLSGPIEHTENEDVYTRNVVLNYDILADLWAMESLNTSVEWIGFCNWIMALPYCKFIKIRLNQVLHEFIDLDD